MTTHYVSRSASEADQTCPRRRFWNTVFHGIGLEPTGTSEDLIVGTALHAGPEALWRTGNIETAVVAMKAIPEWPKLGPMWQYWCEAILRGYYVVRYLVMVKTWEALAIEEEVTYELGTSLGGRKLILLAKPDLVLRHKLTGIIRYVEFKSTRLMDDKFMESWRKAVQLAAGQLCFEARGVIIDQVQVAFWCKGAKADTYWRTPFLSAWRTTGIQARVSKSKTALIDITTGPVRYSAKRPEKWAGWERFDVWESGMTPAEWVTKLTHSDIEKELPETPELIFDPILRADWAEQLAHREGEIADASAEHNRLEHLRLTHPDFTSGPGLENVKLWQRQIRNTHFRQNFRQCRPAQGYPCPFEALCFNPTLAEDPVKSGLYKYREPHHAIEARALGVEE